MRIMKKFKPIFAFSVVFLTGVVSAMTFSELQSAVDAAEAGETVYVTSDIEFNGTLTVAKKVTIASEPDHQYMLTRDAGYKRGQFLDLKEGGDLTLRNLIVDGNKSAGMIEYRCADIDSGKLTLDAGAVLRNFNCTYQGGLFLSNSGAVVMEKGSEIRGFEGVQYGIAALIGSGALGHKCSFTMNGGLITECAGHHKESAIDWDATIYVYGKNTKFHGYGGAIVSNTSDRCSAGVYVYSGNVYLSGDFTMKDNVGEKSSGLVYPVPASGVAENHILVSGDYAGELPLKLRDPASRVVLEDGSSIGSTIQIIWIEDSKRHVGWENIILEDRPDLCLDFDAGLIGGWYPSIKKIRAKVLRADGVRHQNKVDFNTAFAAAESGDTVALCDDFLLVSNHIVSNRTLTISGAGHVLTRGVSGSTLLTVQDSGKLVIRDVVIDGNAPSYTNQYGTVSIQNGGVVELDAGAEIRNSWTQTSSAAFRITGSGSRLVMKEGSLITGCQTTSTNPYGAAVLVGDGTTVSDPQPRFEMEGGAITGCRSDTTSTAVGTYCGAVYLWKGVFDMSGGSITNNFSDNGCSGVVCYNGTVRLTGSAVVADNQGPYPDVYAGSNYRVYYYGDLRGRIGIAHDSQSTGANTLVRREGEATGAWCFFPSRSVAGYVGKIKEVGSTEVVWAEPIGSVAGVKAATADDLQLLLPTAFDLNVGSADYAKLPVVLTGAATGLGANVALTFDVKMRKHMPAWTQPLIAAGADETLTGTWTFALPEGAEKNWSVNATDAAYSLAYLPSGMAVIIR